MYTYICIYIWGPFFGITLKLVLSFSKSINSYTYFSFFFFFTQCHTMLAKTQPTFTDIYIFRRCRRHMRIYIYMYICICILIRGNDIAPGTMFDLTWPERLSFLSLIFYFTVYYKVSSSRSIWLKLY